MEMKDVSKLQMTQTFVLINCTAFILYVNLNCTSVISSSRKQGGVGGWVGGGGVEILLSSKKRVKCSLLETIFSFINKKFEWRQLLYQTVIKLMKSALRNCTCHWMKKVIFKIQLFSDQFWHWKSLFSTKYVSSIDFLSPIDFVTNTF